MARILGRVIIKADLVVKTGLHIGGGNSTLEIGGIDNSVIKNYKGQPYVPGSSLKGKMRSLTELALGKGNGKPCECGECEVCEIYGVGANQGTKGKLPTRIIVRDAFLKPEVAEKMLNKRDEFKDLELSYTESKWENKIDRLNSKAMPRVIERVPEDAVFETEFIYTVFNRKDIDNLNYVLNGLKYLEDDYLGANGTRGYGKVKFQNIKTSIKTISDYANIINLDNKEELQGLDDEWLINIKEYLGCK